MAPFILRRLPAGWTPPAPPPAAAWSAPPEGREDEPVEFSWAKETARHVGTVVHRWLQVIAGDELKGWTPERVAALRPRFARDLARRGVQDAAPAAELVVLALTRTLADERGRWILGPHPEAQSEYRIRTASGRYVIDRLLREPDGTRWIIDYKTSEHQGGGVDAFLDAERERYRAQLERYSQALGGAKRGIYFALLKGWRDW